MGGWQAGRQVVDSQRLGERNRRKLKAQSPKLKINSNNQASRSGSAGGLVEFDCSGIVRVAWGRPHSLPLHSGLSRAERTPQTTARCAPLNSFLLVAADVSRLCLPCRKRVSGLTSAATRCMGRENVSQRFLTTRGLQSVGACLPLLPRPASWGEGEGNARASGSGFGTRDLGRIRAALSRSGSLDIIRLRCGQSVAAACCPLALGARTLVQGLRPRAGVEEQDDLGLDTAA